MATHTVADLETRVQMADLGSMRTEHEAEVMRLLFAVADTTRRGEGNAMVTAMCELKASLDPLFDARYGPLPAQRTPASVRGYGWTVEEISYARPRCTICGGVAETGSEFCHECWEECPEACGECREPFNNANPTASRRCEACDGEGHREGFTEIGRDDRGGVESWEREECQDCDGTGFEAEPRHEGGQFAVESVCERCKP